MKAITICQPYAHLIAIKSKRVENRTWPTRYRGPLAIHAGKSRDWLMGIDEIVYPDMVFGAVVATAKLIACLHIDQIERGDYDKQFPWIREHPHTEGPWCWVMDNVVALPIPLPWKGAQGLWEIADAALPSPQHRDILNFTEAFAIAWKGPQEVGV